MVWNVCQYSINVKVSMLLGCHAQNTQWKWVNTLRPRQHGRHITDDTFKWIFLNENIRFSIKIPLRLFTGLLLLLLLLLLLVVVVVVGWGVGGGGRGYYALSCGQIYHICPVLEDIDTFHVVCNSLFIGMKRICNTLVNLSKEKISFFESYLSSVWYHPIQCNICSCMVSCNPLL